MTIGIKGMDGSAVAISPEALAAFQQARGLPVTGTVDEATWGVLSAAAVIGLFGGLGSFTFYYAEGLSYFSNDPRACVNCHIMREHLSAWVKSSHHAVATCNDCHTPHNFVGKYTTKALNGFWHSFYFTTGRYPDPLRITPRNREVTEHACRYCHVELTENIEHGATGFRNEDEDDRLLCTRCHFDVGHMVR